MTETLASIKDILVIIDADRRAAMAAAQIAQRTEAHLNGVALTFETLLPIYTVATPIPTELIVAAHDQSLSEAELARRDFDAIAKGSGVSASSRVAETIAGDGLLGLVGSCVLNDLAVVGQANPDRREPMREVLIESLLFHARLPLMLIPYAGVRDFRPDRAIIGWNGSSTAARAIRAALPLLSLAKTVTVVVVDEDRPGIAGAEVAAYLARHDIAAQLREIENPATGAGQALLSFAAEQNADWLVMGAYGHSRMREFLLGGVTRHIIADATLPVFMAH
jgi:nucleotide-binding universal stress UspA family protein